mmetsp:Transcript_59499/g.88356  ORF Transcript_59499/g.88356 Transcript_59499/m.88356 type:complete len:265 (+) Transcript_59499:1121-1915(+)
MYGLGTQWKYFNTTAICGVKSRCNTISHGDAHKYFSAGPPYMIHISDVLRFSTVWSSFVPATYDQYPLLYAEMYAYSMAAVHLDLKHTLVKEKFMTGCMVGWPKVNDSKAREALVASSNAYKALVVKKELARADNSATDIGVVDKSGGMGPSSCFPSTFEPPSFLHYCNRYIFSSTPSSLDSTIDESQDQGEDVSYYFFAKRRVDRDIFHCQKREEEFTPWKSTKVESKIANGKGNNGVEWNALSTCAVVRAINYAIERGGCHY